MVDVGTIVIKNSSTNLLKKTDCKMFCFPIFKTITALTTDVYNVSMLDL